MLHSQIDLERAGLSELKEGRIVEYDVVENRGKLSAENLKAASPSR